MLLLFLKILPMLLLFLKILPMLLFLKILPLLDVQYSLKPNGDWAA
jgi:hypothetical protein